MGTNPALESLHPILQFVFGDKKIVSEQELWCQVGARRTSTRFQSTIDLSYLSICRTEAALELRFKETLWAVLSFNNMEGWSPF